jgi:hypothetical protein
LQRYAREEAWRGSLLDAFVAAGHDVALSNNARGHSGQID